MAEGELDVACVRDTENEVGEEQSMSPLTRVKYRVASSVAMTNSRYVKPQVAALSERLAATRGSSVYRSLVKVRVLLTGIKRQSINR